MQSASKTEQLPTGKLEIALIGRSNVGKSSLVNSIAGRHKLANTSKSPGATRLINIFELQPEGSGRWLVDLPGYGYANVPAAEQKRWQNMIEEYLTTRETLHSAILLVDGLVGPTKLDLQTVDWLESIGLDYKLVATKADKVKPSKSTGRRKELNEALGVEDSDVRWVSSSKGTGMVELRAEIAALLRQDAQ